jgi:hypothetical protein
MTATKHPPCVGRIILGRAEGTEIRAVGKWIVAIVSVDSGFGRELDNLNVENRRKSLFIGPRADNVSVRHQSLVSEALTGVYSKDGYVDGQEKDWLLVTTCTHVRLQFHRTTLPGAMTI